MRGNIKEEKKQMMLTENIKTLIPRMAVPTITAQLITTEMERYDHYYVNWEDGFDGIHTTESLDLRAGNRICVWHIPVPVRRAALRREAASVSG